MSVHLSKLSVLAPS